MLSGEREGESGERRVQIGAFRGALPKEKVGDVGRGGEKDKRHPYHAFPMGAPPYNAIPCASGSG